MQSRTFKINADNKRSLMNYIYQSLNEWFNQSKDLEIVVRKYNSKRSIEQNKRLWKIYQIISENAFINGKQYDSDIWHEYLKGKFLGYEVKENIDGSELKIPFSTAKLNTQEMSLYQEKIQAWASNEFGIEWEYFYE